MDRRHLDGDKPIFRDLAADRLDRAGEDAGRRDTPDIADLADMANDGLNLAANGGLDTAAEGVGGFFEFLGALFGA